MEKENQESCRSSQERSSVSEDVNAEFPWCLKLRKSPSLLALIESKLKESKQEKRTDDFAAQPLAEKLKASNFPASHLLIGSWQWKSLHIGDLVAKFYYKRRRLVWEVLDGLLKSKIEIKWYDISAIRTQILHGSEMLEIELNQPPDFFRETDAQPRKHAIWQESGDFTGGQALICRRHTMIFPLGTLEKHYEKLLHFDQRLFDLSKKPFPSHNYPYFDHNTSGFSPTPTGFNDYPLEFPHDQHKYHVQNDTVQPILPGEFPHVQITCPYINVTEQMSRMSVAETPLIGYGGCSYPYDIQLGNQGVRNHLPGNANQNDPAQPILRQEFPHDQRTHSHFDVTNQNSLMSEVPFIDNRGCTYPYDNQWGNQGISSPLQGYANQTYPTQPILPQEFPHDQITPPDPNITNQNPLRISDIPFIDNRGCSYHYSDQWDNQGISNPLQGNANQRNYPSYGVNLSRMHNNPPNNELGNITNHMQGNLEALFSTDEMAFFNELLGDNQLPVQSSPTFQIPDNDMNIHSLMNTSSNPHGQGPQGPQGQSQSNRRSSSNRYPNQGNHPDTSSQ